MMMEIVIETGIELHIDPITSLKEIQRNDLIGKNI